MYDVTELATAVKPWLLRHLLERDGAPRRLLRSRHPLLRDIDEIARLTVEQEWC